MLINGEPGSSLPVTDRGLAYGDGLFETIRFREHRLLFGPQHMQRLARGVERLNLQCDWSALESELTQILELATHAEGVLKLLLTRGSAGRGYRVAGSQPATRILTLHPLPDYDPHAATTGIRAFLCRQRLALQPALAGIKHLNRLEQVMASLEWPDESFLEGLMLDQQGKVIEGTRSNVFLASGGMLLTPMLDQCGIDGVLQKVLLQHFGSSVTMRNVSFAELLAADEIFFCNSVFGIWPVASLHADQLVHHWQPGAFAVAARALFEASLLS